MDRRVAAAVTGVMLVGVALATFWTAPDGSAILPRWAGWAFLLPVVAGTTWLVWRLDGNGARLLLAVAVPLTFGLAAAIVATDAPQGGTFTERTHRVEHLGGTAFSLQTEGDPRGAVLGGEEEATSPTFDALPGTTRILVVVALPERAVAVLEMAVGDGWAEVPLTGSSRDGPFEARADPSAGVAFGNAAFRVRLRQPAEPLATSHHVEVTFQEDVEEACVTARTGESCTRA